MKIITSGEILYRLDDNWHLVYSPERQTIAITCPARQAHKPHKFIPKGISQFQRPTGCWTELTDHFVYSDSSISSNYGLEHIELHNIVSLNISNVSPEHLEAIMSEMIKDGLYRPTMNDIIEAHEHQKTSLTKHQSPWSCGSYSLSCLYLLLPSFPIPSITYNILATISTVLKLKTRKALYTFLSTFLSNHILNTPKSNPSPNSQFLNKGEIS